MPFNQRPTIEYVQRAEETKEQLENRVRPAENFSAWEIGEAAYIYNCMGHTDKELAEATDVSRSAITQRRLVWEKFGTSTMGLPSARERFGNLSWTHFREALQWDDAGELLVWAHDGRHSVNEMILEWDRRGRRRPPRPVPWGEVRERPGR